MSFNGSAMDTNDAQWYGDFLDTPVASAASSSQAQFPPLSQQRAEPYINITPHSSTRGSRALCKMDSEQALDLYLQGTDTGQGGAGHSSNT